MWTLSYTKRSWAAQPWSWHTSMASNWGKIRTTIQQRNIWDNQTYKEAIWALASLLFARLDLASNFRSPISRFFLCFKHNGQLWHYWDAWSMALLIELSIYILVQIASFTVIGCVPAIRKCKVNLFFVIVTIRLKEAAIV